MWKGYKLGEKRERSLLIDKDRRRTSDDISNGFGMG